MSNKRKGLRGLAAIVALVTLGSSLALANEADRSYDSARSYSGACDPDFLYWSDLGVTPDCAVTRNVIDKNDFHCVAAAASLRRTGRFDNQLAQYRNGGNNGDAIGPYRWQFLAPGHINSPVECQADWGVHGDGRSDFVWPAAGSNVSDQFTADLRNALSWETSPRNRSYTVYDGNYLNWLNGAPGAARPQVSQLDMGQQASNDGGQCTMTTTQPVVAVNAANRTQHLNDVYIALHNRQPKAHWPGNLKKYRFEQQRIVDVNGSAVIDTSGTSIQSSARSFWASDAADGNDVFTGGAAQRLPAADMRRLYSNIVSSDLRLDGNAIVAGNAALQLADFGLTGSAQEPTVTELVTWARGADIRDEDSDAATNLRRSIGDTLNSQPAAIVYSNNDNGADTVVFVATNDGYLHAFSGQDGTELWAFIPRQLLAGLARLYFDQGTKHKQYGLDGDIVPIVKDVDGDGTIEAQDGDLAYLIFGMRRGGHSYFALDVTDKDAPRVLWTYDSYESGESWSTPSIARMHIAGKNQNTDHAVVVIGGGYDTAHDTNSHPAGADGSGAGIHILDLATGERLWRAGPDAGADLPLNRTGRAMDRAIPNQVRVIDLNGDGFADRMYASDLGGQLWRFDVHNGQSADDLITGGVIAQLGANGSNATVAADATRRFYNAPDVSLATDVTAQQRFLAISIGSGYRAHLMDTSSSDRFFSIRDPQVFTSLSQQDYDNYAVVTVGDLVDVSDDTPAAVGASDRGWMYSLPASEKVLSDSLTFADQVVFVAFEPRSQDAAACGAEGVNHLYRLNIVDGSPVAATDSGQSLTTVARAGTLNYQGVAPSPIILFPGPASDCTGAACGVRPIACVGTECFDPELDATPVRTLWAQDGVE